MAAAPPFLAHPSQQGLGPRKRGVLQPPTPSLSSRDQPYSKQPLHRVDRMCSPSISSWEEQTSLIPRDTLAGTAAWLIQKETQDMATNRTEGM